MSQEIEIQHDELGEVVNLGPIRQLKRAPEPHVYIITLKDSSRSFLKVGSTSNLRSRINSLMTATPFDVEFSFALMSPVPDWHIVIENYAHKELNEYHIKGEWFEVPLEVAIAAVRAGRDFVVATAVQE